MGGQTSGGSFKKNNSNANSINFVNSQEFSFNTGNSIKSMTKDADVLTKFVWNYGGHQVLLTGSFNRWTQTIPLQRSGQQFSATILLPRGLHYYKFIVDGEWRFSPEDPSMPDSSGNINNFIDTTNYHPLIERQSSDDYSSNYFKTEQNIPEIQQFNKQAPLLPINYDSCKYISGLSTKKNKESKSMEIQISGDKKHFEESLSQSQVQQLFNSSHCLQSPTHVTLDHLIMHKQNKQSNYKSMAITQRFKSKYTTFKYFTVSNK